jgi:rubrerythrin
MTSQVESALKALEEGMRLEQEGLAFYREAAKRTKSKTGQHIFRSLAQDEALHQRLIQRQIDHLSAKGRWREIPQAKGEKAGLSQPIFPQGREGLEKAVKADTSDTEALILALEFETKGYDMYRREAEAVMEAAAREMYEFLATQERAHFDLLMANYESMVHYGGWAD